MFGVPLLMRATPPPTASVTAPGTSHDNDASALLLAVTGVYGVTSYLMQQRTREFGIRLALGSSPGQLQTMVLRQGIKLIATSIVLGFVGAIGLAQMLKGTFFGVTTGDPFVFAVAPLVLAATATIAIWLPARRASTADPTIAMRA